MKRVLVVMMLAATSCGKEEPAARPAGMSAVPAGSADRAKDVICGMPVDKATGKKLTHESATYYFCGDECVKKFQADPKKYAVPCVCGKASGKCPCEHCGHHHHPCDCGK